jgi:hypothetical protein
MKIQITMAAAIAALAACNVTEVIAPVPVDVGTGGNGAGGGGGSGGTDPGPVKRTVETRPTWSGPSDNLLVDGDFELSITIEGVTGQSGFIGFAQNQQAYIRGETGGICRTGLRCGVLEPGVALFGKGVSAAASGMTASVWTKPPAAHADCALVTPFLVSCNTGVLQTDMLPVSPTPDASGWCEYTGAVAQTNQGVCMYLENTLGPDETALVDAAVLVPDDGSRSAGASGSMSSDTAERVRAVVRRLRDTTPIGELARRAPPIGDR